MAVGAAAAAVAVAVAVAPCLWGAGYLPLHLLLLASWALTTILEENSGGRGSDTALVRGRRSGYMASLSPRARGRGGRSSPSSSSSAKMAVQDVMPHESWFRGDR